MFCLMAYPFLGYIIASLHGGMLSPRFVIPVCLGFAIAATLTASQIFKNVRPAGLVFVCFMMAWFCCRESYVGYWYEEQKQCFYKVLAHLPEAESELPANAPIVIPDPLLVLTFWHYAPSALAARVVFPVDFPAIRQFRGDDSPEENLWAGRNFLYSFPIEPLAAFQRATHQYLIIAADGNWLLQDLDQHHYPVERLPINTRAGARWEGSRRWRARNAGLLYGVCWDNSILYCRSFAFIAGSIPNGRQPAGPRDRADESGAGQ